MHRDSELQSVPRCLSINSGATLREQRFQFSKPSSAEPNWTPELPEVLIVGHCGSTAAGRQGPNGEGKTQTDSGITSQPAGCSPREQHRALKKQYLVEGIERRLSAKAR